MTSDKREKAIKYLTEEIRSLRMAPQINGCGPENWTEQLEIMETCLEAVRACHIGEATDMVPLPLEQLMGMEKPTPVWAEVENKTIEGWGGYWCLCVRGHILTPSLISMYAEKMEGVKFYSHHPAHIDREAICGSWEGEADGYADGGLVYDVWHCGDCGHIEETDDPDLLPHFCPNCGRAMTPKAWAELDKRLRG